MAKTRLVATLLGLALLVAAVVAWQRAKVHLREQTLEARNARAEASVTKTGLLELANGYTRYTTRLAEEHEVELDDVGRKLYAEGRARIMAEVQLAAVRDTLYLERTSSAERDTATGIIHAADSIDARETMGVAAAADVTLTPAAEDRTSLVAEWRWRLYRAAVGLRVILACEERNASVNVLGPPWLELEIPRVQQDDEICVPPVGWDPFSFELPSLPTGSAILVVGVILGAVLF